jgi:hypothetical protein
MASRFERTVEAAAREILEPGESVVAALRASRSQDRQPGPHELVGGAVGMILDGSIDRARANAQRAEGDPYAFRLTESMALAVTERRLLFWAYGGLVMQAPRQLLGTIPLAVIEKVEYSRSAGTIGLWLPTRTIELGVPRGQDDAGRAFAMAARERIAALA